MSRIATFLGNYPKKNTRSSYRTGIRLFFDTIYQGDRVNEDQHYEHLADRYLSELEAGKRSLSADMNTYAEVFTDKPPLTARNRIASVKEFFADAGHEMTHREIKNMQRRVPKGYALTEEADLSPEILRKIISHCDLRGRAFFLVLVSSGMRVDELLHIELSDIDLTKTPTRINIKGKYTKTGEPRISFCSTEATEAIQSWLQVRNQYLKSAGKRNAGLVAAGLSAVKNLDDPRLFPFRYTTAIKIWDTSVQNAKLYDVDRNTNRTVYHIHMLRKFFRTQSAVKVPVDIVESIMGHTGYLTRSYRKYPKEQLAEFYLKMEPVLTVFSVEDPETRSRVQVLEQEIKALRDAEERRKDATNVASLIFSDLTTDPAEFKKFMQIYRQMKQNESEA